jgi:hypothetical protein
MSLTAIVEKIDDRHFRAAIVQPFAMESEGTTEDEALNRLREMAIARLGSRKMVEIRLPDEETENPWRKLAGMFKGHQDWSEYLKNIEEYRREMNQPESR